MKTSILCIVAGFLLFWVIYLKLRISALRRQQEQFIRLLKRHVAEVTGDVEVVTFLKLWGKKVQCEEVDTSWTQRRDTK